jgi:hypothetical protein
MNVTDRARRLDSSLQFRAGPSVLMALYRVLDAGEAIPGTRSAWVVGAECPRADV